MIVRKQFSHICTVRKLAKDYFFPLIFNTLNGQWTEDILKLLDPKSINVVVIIPTNFTNQLQPLDLSINKTVTEFLQIYFRNGMQNKSSINAVQRKSSRPEIKCYI